MATNDPRSSEQKQYTYDDAVFKPSPIDRVSLPNDEVQEFAEVQNFDQIWLWVIMGIQLFIIMVPLILTGQSWWSIAIALVAVVLSMALLGSLRLNTWMDAEGIHYKMKLFHWKVRTIPWDEIDQIYVREYSPVKEYGGWGIKYGKGGWAVNVRGNQGIQIKKKDGKRTLIGTQKPDEAAAYLASRQLLV